MTAKGHIFKVAQNFMRTSSNFTRDTFINRPDILWQKNKLVEIFEKKLEVASKSKIAHKMRVAKEYYTLELSPPGIKELDKIKHDFALAREFIQNGCWKFMTVKQAWLMFLIGVEVLMWFYMGEVLGKMHIVGYKV